MQPEHKPILSELGIEYRKLYQTRHGFITLALENGLDAKDVARLVGNSPEVIYHVPGSKGYNGTKPETCFKTAADAEKAGFRAPK